MIENYVADGLTFTDDERACLMAAAAILESKFKGNQVSVTSPAQAGQIARLRMAGLEYECFGVFFLDAQHCLIAYEEMFRGSLAEVRVYPREVVKSALKHNCRAVLLAHNHPSQNATPSRADEMLTNTLKSALQLVDVSVLDHFVVTASSVTSFAEMGLL